VITLGKSYRVPSTGCCCEPLWELALSILENAVDPWPFTNASAHAGGGGRAALRPSGGFRPETQADLKFGSASDMVIGRLHK
jgi:hypothetical protein